MLYVFNSAYRPLYAKNVLNTLYLPYGWTNEYRYKYAGDTTNISPTTYSSLSTLHSGTKCVVIFVDRFSNGGYSYHPLRFAEYVQNRSENEYAYIRIKLQDFVYPVSARAFNQSIIGALGAKGLPALTNNDPENAHDGFYVIEHESIFVPPEGFRRGDSAWGDAVQQLSTARALTTNDSQAPVFLRLYVAETGKQHKLDPHLKEGSALYQFTKNKSYDLVLTYRYPRQRVDHTSRTSFRLKVGDNFRPSDIFVAVDSHANSVEDRFVTKRYIDDDAGSFRLEPKDVAAGEPELLLANSSLSYQIRESKAFWLQLTAALLLLSIVGALIGMDFSKIAPFTASNVFHTAKLKLLLSVLQSAILFWVFRMIGKKIL
jgi:hypothetical protein